MFYFLGTAISAAKPEVTLLDGRLSIKADDAPLLPLLESIQNSTGVDILVSKDLNPGNISIQINGIPIEAAIKRLLTPFNAVMIYKKQGDEIRLCTVKIYPHGKSTGPLLALSQLAPNKGVEASATKIFLEPTPKARGKRAESGLLIPNQYSEFKDKTLRAKMGKRFQVQEQKAYQEIRALKNKIALTENKDEKYTLNLVLMEKLEAFERLQRVNRNKLEAFHRIELFNQSKLTKQDNNL